MINKNQLEVLKLFAELQVNQIQGGAAYCITEGNTVTWGIKSSGFNIHAFTAGMEIPEIGAPVRAMKEKKTIVMTIPRAVYGTRASITSIPIVNDEGTAVGALSAILPRQHHITSGFPHFAPILAEMFPEGVFMYITDLQKVILRQPSQKFDIPDFTLGYELKESDIASRSIRSRNLNSAELDAAKWGVPILVMNYPLFDDETDEVVGTFGVVLPKGNAALLKEMSENLDNGLNGISAAVEQLAASASQIHSNERELNSTLKEVFTLSEQIDEISSFIKTIADQTKMLGLNAAIEAARAGEFGRGFNVVAQEIRKLSDQSVGAVPRIKGITELIKAKATSASSLSETSLESSQEQSAASQEITASVEEITSLADELNKLSKEL